MLTLQKTRIERVTVLYIKNTHFKSIPLLLVYSFSSFLKSKPLNSLKFFFTFVTWKYISWSYNIEEIQAVDTSAVKQIKTNINVYIF